MQTFPLGAQTAWPIRICLSLPSSLQVPRAMSLFLYVAHGLRWILGLATLSILQRRGLYPGLTGGEDRVSGSHPPSQVPMLTSPLHALTGGRQVALFGASCSPLPLTLLAGRVSASLLGQRCLRPSMESSGGRSTPQQNVGTHSQWYSKVGQAPQWGQATVEGALIKVGPAPHRVPGTSYRGQGCVLLDLFPGMPPHPLAWADLLGPLC